MKPNNVRVVLKSRSKDTDSTEKKSKDGKDKSRKKKKKTRNRKVAPETQDGTSTDASMSHQRNKELAERAEKQMGMDGRNQDDEVKAIEPKHIHPGSEVLNKGDRDPNEGPSVEPKRASHEHKGHHHRHHTGEINAIVIAPKRFSLGRDEKGHLQYAEGTNDEPKDHHQIHHHHRHMEDPPEEPVKLKPPVSLDAEAPPAFRLDAVVVTALFAVILGSIAVILEWYVYALDQNWNDVLNGDRAIVELKGHEVFREKTYNLGTHKFLEKAREYSLRNENQEVLFIAFIMIFIGAAIMHMCACYIRAPNVDQYSTILILLYSVGGALCIYSSTFLVSSSTNIENGYMYAADMLYNFQHMLDDHHPVSSAVECTGTMFQRGCDSYEMARQQATNLEMIYRLCGDGSRYSRYYQSGKPFLKELMIQDTHYSREELKTLGFCSRDGFKYVAALLAILTGVVSALVPVVYCCDDKDDDEEPSDMVEEAPAPAPIPVMTLTPPPKEVVFDPARAIEAFTEYVEKESDEDEKDSKMYARETFEFIPKDDAKNPEPVKPEAVNPEAEKAFKSFVVKQ